MAREGLAGLNLLALSLPLNVGYAQIAGLPPAAGLYALILPAVLFALTAASRQVVAAPDAAAAALVGSSLLGVAVAGRTDDYAAMAAAQAILCGLVLVLMSVRHLGFLARFLSEPILLGFVAGLAIEVLAGQLAKMTGIDHESEGGAVRHVVELLGRLGSAQPWTVLVAAGSITVLLLGRRLLPGAPWALVVLVLSTAVVAGADLTTRGVAALGPVEAGLPPVSWPSLPPDVWLALVPSAVALALVVSAEGLLIDRRYARRHGDPYDPDRDLGAFGLANVGAGLTGGFTVGSSVSRTAAMDAAGSRSQLPSLVAAAGALLLLLGGTSLIEQVPSAAVGAVVTVAVLPLLRLRGFVRLGRQDRVELVLALTCVAAVLALGPLQGVLLAFVLSVIDLTRRAASPPVEVLRGGDGGSLVDGSPAGSVTAPGVVVVRVAGPLFFASAGALEDGVMAAVGRAGPGLRHVVLDLEAVQTIDVTAAETLERLERWCEGAGCTWSYSRVRPQVLDRLGGLGLLDGVVVYPTNRKAVQALAR